MDRAGKRATPLTPDEMRKIFELASSGMGQEQAQHCLTERNRTTVNRAYNVAVEFELRGITSLDDTTAHQIVDAAAYSATVTRVKDLFLQWGLWKGRDESIDLTRVREEATLTHIEKLGKVAEELEHQLYLPRPYDAGSWVPPQAMLHEPVAISTGSRPVRVRPHYVWEPAEADAGLLRLIVEEDLYFPCLQGHLSDESFWRSFEDWKKKGAAYLYACRQLPLAIVHECQQRTGSSILISQEWPQEGIFWHFAEHIYVRHTDLVKGMSGVDTWDFTSNEEPSREPGQGRVHELWHGSHGIICHRDWNVLQQWKSIYDKMMGGDDWTAQANYIVEGHDNLKDMAKTIREILRKAIERGTFEGGRCELCP